MAVYPVGAGQTYATIQAAHDQLVIDQGVAAFTEEQEIRIYDGTYTEYVLIDHTLEPQPRYHLVFKAAAGKSPVWSCQGLAGVMTTAGVLAFVDFDGIAFSGTSSGNYPMNLHWNSYNFEFRSCTFTLIPTGTYVMRYSYANLHFIDCELDGSTSGGADQFLSTSASNHAHFIRCHIHDYLTLTPASTVGDVHLEACRIHDVTDVIWAGSLGGVVLLNNTFYNITGSVILDRVGRSRLVMVDNIFDTVLAVVEEVADADDAFSSSEVVIDGNCYNNVTKWYDSVAESDVITFAAWQAKGYDANGIESDPLFTDAPSDDFSLGAASPARHAGQGAGVITGYNGVAFDRFHPDIGAWSSGTLTVTAPSITAAVDDESGTTATLTLNADNALDVLTVRYRKTPGTAEWTTFGSTRTGDGDLQITGLEVWGYEFIAHATRGGLSSLASNPAFVKVSTGTMTLKKAFWRLLLSLPDVTGLVGDRITAVPASQTVALPYITYTVVSDVDTHHMKGAAGFAQARIQVDSYGATYEDADAVAEALRLNLDGYDSTVTHGTDSNEMQVRLTSSQDGPFDPDPAAEVGPFRVSQDYWVQHEKSIPSPP